MMRSNVLLILTASMLASSAMGSVQITRFGVTGSAGSTLEQPLDEGQSFSLECDVRADHGDTFDTCTFTHVLNREYHDLNEGPNRGGNYGGPRGNNYGGGGGNSYGGGGNSFGGGGNNYGGGGNNYGGGNSYGGSYSGRGSNSGGYAGRSDRYGGNRGNNLGNSGQERWSDNYDDSAPVLKCSITVDQSSSECGNTAGTDDLDRYADRIRMSADTSGCRLSVNNAHKWDNGEWACHVSHTVGINERSHSLTSASNVFVAAAPDFTYFTMPNQLNDQYAIIEYAISDPEDRYRPQNEIVAECTSFGGVPRPELVWAIGDVRNIIRNVRPVPTGNNEHQVTETLRFAPTLDQLCDEYNVIVGGDVCNERPEDRDIDDLDNFSFDLICFPTPNGQRDNFPHDPSNLARITVEVRAGAASLSSLSFVTSILVAISLALS